MWAEGRQLNGGPFPATASAEGRQLNGGPFPATVSAEGRQLNGAPSLAGASPPLSDDATLPQGSDFLVVHA